MEGLKEGSRSEDQISPQRIWNWHFYGEEEDNYRSWFGANKTSLKRVKSLVARLADTSQTLSNHPQDTDLVMKKAVLVGRLLHHIQDMSCPPHVVPVYHVSKDRYETLMPPLNAVDFQEPPTVITDFVKLYHDTAKLTKDRVRDTPLKLKAPGIPGTNPVTLSLFWKEPPADTKTFGGTYGPDKTDQFGFARGEDRWLFLSGRRRIL